MRFCVCGIIVAVVVGLTGCGGGSGGVDYQINATGAVQPESHSLTIQATVTASNGAGHENAVVSGDRISDEELPPPPPPFDLPSDSGYELPPPPPGYPPDTPEMPPPTPPF